MSAFLYIDWTYVAAAAAAASIFASIWMTDRRESRDISDSERERNQLVGRAQSDVRTMRGELDDVRKLVLEVDKRLAVFEADKKAKEVGGDGG